MCRLSTAPWIFHIPNGFSGFRMGWAAAKILSLGLDCVCCFNLLVVSLGRNISDQGSDTLSNLFGLCQLCGQEGYTDLGRKEQKMMLQITNTYQWQICLEQCLMWACSGRRWRNAIAVTWWHLCRSPTHFHECPNLARKTIRKRSILQRHGKKDLQAVFYCHRCSNHNSMCRWWWPTKHDLSISSTQKHTYHMDSWSHGWTGITAGVESLLTRSVKNWQAANGKEKCGKCLGEYLHAVMRMSSCLWILTYAPSKRIVAINHCQCFAEDLEFCIYTEVCSQHNSFKHILNVLRAYLKCPQAYLEVPHTYMLST